jgi:SAM-dependent methyltransferase
MAFSQAAENNKEPIARVLRDVFKEVRQVLEIGAGTGQHAVHFARALPHLTWRPSDLAANLDDIRERLARDGVTNVAPPLPLDVTERPWPALKVDGVFAANCLHIMSWAEVEHLFGGIGEVLEAGGGVCLYGPFKYGGAFTTESNARFDTHLKRRDPASGIRDFEAVDALARAQGLRLIRDAAMPANNQLLVWRRHGAGD